MFPKEELESYLDVDHFNFLGASAFGWMILKKYPGSIFVKKKNVHTTTARKIIYARSVSRKKSLLHGEKKI